jgi:hypothetical protein
MKAMRSVMTCLCAVSLAAWGEPLRDSATLQFNDSTAPADVVMKGGHAYVPVTAVAKLLNSTVQVDGSTFKFVPLDNSRQVNGNEGKVGEMIRLGYANLTVTSVDVGTSYKAKFGGSDSTADTGKKIVAITIHIQNSTLKSQLCSVLGGDSTALADANGRSYVASNFSDFERRGTELLPGAAVDLTLLFNVPDSIELKDLVYEVLFNSLGKSKVARVHLK